MTSLEIAVCTPLLVFGGPYSNARALRALREAAADLGIPSSRVVCTGDVVAYGAEPEETVQAVRDWGCHVVAGNCEEQLAAGAEDCGCGFEEGSACDVLSKGWYPFARSLISKESAQWMGTLPKAITFAIGGTSFRVIHGGVHETSRFLFASQTDRLDAELDMSAAEVVVAGHCGVPFAHVASQSAGRAWFNPGVIGMPANDGTADGWYGIIRGDDGGWTFETRRLRYDAVGAAAAMRRTGHANGYARSLITGRWPSLDVLPPTERTATGKPLPELTVRLPTVCAPVSV